jgi:hypothetical protein
VGIEEFGEDALKERMKDHKWLEQHIWQHARVLKAAMRFGTVIPMRFLTVFRSEERIGKSLMALEETLRGLFAKLQDKEEWGVKAFCDPQCIREDVEAQFERSGQFKAQIVGKSSGTAYLLRKQFEELVKRESALRMAVHLESIHGRIMSEAYDTKINPVAKDSPNHQMVLNETLLVSKSSVGSLVNEVNMLRQEYLPCGFEFELVGPFPPYSFSELPARVALNETGTSEGAAHV